MRKIILMAILAAALVFTDRAATLRAQSISVNNAPISGTWTGTLTLPSPSAVYLDQASDKTAATPCSVSPDGIPDLHFKLSGLLGTPVGVGVQGNATNGGTWGYPCGPAKLWEPAVVANPDGSVDVWVQFWVYNPSYTFIVQFAGGIAETVTTNGTMPSPTPKPSPSPTPSPVASIKANDFLNTLGVATHMTQGADNPASVQTAMAFAGFRNIREDGTADATKLANYVTMHNAIGTKFDLLPQNGNVNGSLSMYETLASAGALLAAEGPNEVNNFPITYNGATSSVRGSYVPVAQFQAALYAAIKADTKLAGVPVFAPAEAGGSEPDNVGLQFLTIPAGAGTAMADGTKYANFANTHNYVIGNGMTAPINNTAWGAEAACPGEGSWDGPTGEYGPTTWNKHFNGYSCPQIVALPRVTTETGWVTQGSNAISEAAQGKLFLNLFLSAVARGWSNTFIYMLHDDAGQGYWGLFHTDWTPKASATYMHNLTTILADTTSAFTPAVVGYSIAREPTTVHDFLIQKSNGASEIAVWGDQVTGSNVVTVNLGKSYATVNIYDPTVGATPTLTLNNVSAVPLTLSDHALLVEVK